MLELSLSQFSSALPEIFLLVAACVILVIDVSLPARLRYVTYALIQGVLGGAFILALLQFQEYPEPLYSFSGHFVIDKLAVLSKLTIYLFSFFAFAYARDYIRSRNIPDSEYYLLGLFAVMGMSIMASANSFLTIFLGLELLSLPLYAMVAMYKDSSDAAESAMKFFVLGSLATGILLYGISMLYGLTGTLELHTVAKVLADRTDAAPIVAMVFIIAGLIFKFGAVPFHMWVPDVYQGSKNCCIRHYRAHLATGAARFANQLDPDVDCDFHRFNVFWESGCHRPNQYQTHVGVLIYRAHRLRITGYFSRP
jgi:NADH-quinone oxidoreductase subunit N